ncbi:MAG: CBS domain-containing protein [Gaiellaceae bacterium]
MTGSNARYLVQTHETIEVAMLLIEENRHRSVVVLEGDTVVGTLSDGDIRKAILDRRLLTTPVEHVMNMNFVSLRDDDRDRARELFQGEDLFLIPVVDADGKLVDVETAYPGG